MRPLSPYIADQLTQMLEMTAAKLARRMKCSATNADRAQKLIVLTLVRNYRASQGQNAAALERQGRLISEKLARGKESEMAGVFQALLSEAQRTRAVGSFKEG